MAIEQTLLRSGDTDTNAAIVGGLMGAFWGAKAIPETMSKPVLSFEFDPNMQWERQGKRRPDNLRGNRILHTAEALLKMAKSLKQFV